VVATAAAAACRGLTGVSAGATVWVPTGPPPLLEALPAEGYAPIGVALSELRRGGGGVKCCTQEPRPPRPRQEGPRSC